ncbi:MAG: pilus assembly protein [Selenomonadaceae bacterium]|nr:pilus assembly protein [Selenomonadaceae bacterium]
MQIKKFFPNSLQKIFFSRRGQMLVLFALLIPIILLFVGLGIDLGWYYLNVSRLQNAADAAALAGARKIINSNSTKLKDLVPVLVQNLPEDNGLTDDGEPRVETSTSTETTTNTTETEEGTTITTTETTTTTTTTISKTQLTDLDWSGGDITARNYTVKNIDTTQNIQADADETASLIIDSWSLFYSDFDRQVVPDLNLVKVNGEFYYVVKLDENIRHFFLPGWFKNMDAKVVAIAKLVPKDQVTVETSTEIKTIEEFIAKLRETINKNVIVGNWEVQNKYKNTGGGLLNVSDLNITDPTTSETVKFYDSEGNERTQVTAYEASFGNEVYRKSGVKPPPSGVGI